MAVSVAGKSAKQTLEERKELIEKARADYDAKGDAATDEDMAALEAAMEDAAKLSKHAKAVRQLELAEENKTDWEQREHEQRDRLRHDPQDGTDGKRQKLTIALRNGWNPDG